SAADPGGDTLNVNGPGQLVVNTSGNPIPDIGDTFHFPPVFILEGFSGFSPVSAPRDPAGNLTSSVGQSISLGTTLYSGISQNGFILQHNFSWTVTGGPYTAASTDYASTSLTFVPLAGGTHVVTLTATDPQGTTSASVAIDVSPPPPAVNISLDP